MTNYKECIQCKKQIADEASFCPVCGKPQKADKVINPLQENLSKGMIIGSLIFAAIILYGAKSCVDSVFSPSTNEQKQVLSQPDHIIPEIGKLYKTKGGWPIAITTEELEHALTLLKDKEAFLKLIEQNRTNLLKPGLVVYCDDVKFPGMVKIRPKGQTDGLWTVIEALEPL